MILTALSAQGKNMIKRLFIYFIFTQYGYVYSFNHDQEQEIAKSSR